MNIMTRRMSIASLAGLAAALPGMAKAQFTEQEVRNETQVVGTGDINVNQSASGSQIVDINGTPINGDGVYRTETGQVVVNDGQVVGTGDINVNQSASGTQTVHQTFSPPEYEGQPAEACSPGAVLANFRTGQLFFQADDCCWYLACADSCKRRACEGSNCG